MGFCATVPDALRHGVGFMPYNILPQIPPISPQGKGQKPRDPHQILALVAVWRFFLVCPWAFLVLAGGCGPDLVA